MHPFFAKLGYKEGDFPIAEKVSKEVLSIPVHPALSGKDLDEITRRISEFYA